MRGSCYLISLFLISGALAGCLDSYLDEDGDGVNNDIDNCYSASNPEQNNTDGDEFGDECDFDALRSSVMEKAQSQLGFLAMQSIAVDIADQADQADPE